MDETCWECGGSGVVIDCIDDMCHGADECIHGDGESVCPECDGTGVIGDREDDDAGATDGQP